MARTELELPRTGIARVIPHAKIAVSLSLLVVVTVFIASSYETTAIIGDVRRLGVETLAIVALVLLANALIAVLRFKLIASDMGHQVLFRSSMATVSAGSLA